MLIVRVYWSVKVAVTALLPVIVTVVVELEPEASPLQLTKVQPRFGTAVNVTMEP